MKITAPTIVNTIVIVVPMTIRVIPIALRTESASAREMDLLSDRRRLLLDVAHACT